MRRGQALVEFAFVLPVMLMLLLGLVDFGRAYVIAISLEGAVREGARLAITSATDADVTVRVQQAALPVVLNASDISICAATVTPPTLPPACPASGLQAAATSGQAVTVTTYTFVSFYTAFLTQRLGFNGLHVQTSATMLVQ